MDAIKELAHAAAQLSYEQEKTAGIGSFVKQIPGALKYAFMPVAKGSASAARMAAPVAQTSAGFARSAMPTVKGSASAFRSLPPAAAANTAQAAKYQFVPRSAMVGAGVGAAGLGALGAKDAFQGATGGWSGENQLGWHRQRMQGADYNAPMGGWVSPQAWGRTLGSPLKSALAMGAGPGPDYIAGQWQPSGGVPVMNPATGYEEYSGGMFSRKPTYSPQIQGQLKAYQDNQNQYEQMRKQHLQSIDTEQTNLDSGNYSGSGTVAAQRLAQEAKLQELQKQLGAGDYGSSGWFGNNAAYYRDQADQMAPQLQRIGALGREAAGFQPAQLPGPPQPGSLDSDYSFLNYGM